MLAPSGCSLFVGLNDYVKGSPLASQTFSVPASLEWQQVRCLMGMAAVVVYDVTLGLTANPLALQRVCNRFLHYFVA